ncbi:hypothetical protein U1Q18_027964 [Sarracenia purpurea var. burkii]
MKQKRGEKRGEKQVTEVLGLGKWVFYNQPNKPSQKGKKTTRPLHRNPHDGATSNTTRSIVHSRYRTPMPAPPPPPPPRDHNRSIR